MVINVTPHPQVLSLIDPPQGGLGGVGVVQDPILKKKGSVTVDSGKSPNAVLDPITQITKEMSKILKIIVFILVTSFYPHKF